MAQNGFNQQDAAIELQKWLDGAANYSIGIELYLKYGGDKGLAARTLKPRGACAANKRLLKSKITSMISEYSATITAKPETENGKLETQTGKQETENSKLSTENAELGTQNSKPETPKRVELPQVGLRKLYPNIKLEDAPDEIKLMFAEALGAYNKCVSLFDNSLDTDNTAEMTEDEVYAKLEELYLANENNKLAHAELKHFNDTCELLGKHPKLEMAAYKQKMQALYTENPVKVQKERDKCYNNYARHKKQLEEGEFKDKTEKEGYVTKWKTMLDICDAILPIE